MDSDTNIDTYLYIYLHIYSCNIIIIDILYINACQSLPHKAYNFKCKFWRKEKRYDNERVRQGQQ